MKWHRLVLVLAMCVAVQPIGAPSRQDSAHAPPAVEVTERDTGDLQHVEWALGRFGAVGLQVPAVAVAFFDDTTACRGSVALFTAAGDELAVRICQTGPNEIRWSLLHELAHAWDHAGGLDAVQRTEFLELRGLDTWHDPDLTSAAMGCEQAAEIVAWGLALDWTNLRTSLGHIGPQTSQHLADAFRVLTGGDPLWMAGAGSSAG